MTRVSTASARMGGFRAPLCVLLACGLMMFLSMDVKSEDKVKIPPGVLQMLTDAEKNAVASVDGDPDFIVGINGLDQPLCFRLEGEPGHVVRLLQDPESGVVVNARISRPVPGSKKTYLSAVLISRRNFRVVAKVGRVLVNRYRFAWGPVSVRLVHGHRVLIAPTLLALTFRNKNLTLVVKRHLPEGRLVANGTTTNSTINSAPNIARGFPPGTTTNHTNNTPGTTTIAVTARRRGGSRRRTEVERGPRPRNRRHRRRQRGQRRQNKKDKADNSGNDNNNNKGDKTTKKKKKKKKTNPSPSSSSSSSSTSKKTVRNKRDTLVRNTDRWSSSDADGGSDTTPLTSRAKRSRRAEREHGERRSSKNSRKKGGDATAASSRRDSSLKSMDMTIDAESVHSNENGSSSTTPSPGSGVRSVSTHELAAYMGFYVSDARDLSTETHGLLGQFLHKAVSLQRVRRKSNGVTKARLFVEKPFPHHVKAKLRTRTNMALNSSSTCWWLRDGGVGVVDGTYSAYLVSRFRGADLLPLPPPTSAAASSAAGRLEQ